MKTPLYQKHIEAGARMAPFAGWQMPIQYEGIIAEHQHTRTVASVFDICHMGEFELSGRTSEQDLERLLTQRISSLKVGQCRYGYLLDDNGGVLDDLTCYRLADERYLLVVNAGTSAVDSAWIQAHLSEHTTFCDRSEDLAKIDVQGPESRRAIEAAFGVKLPDLGYFRAEEIELVGAMCLISRTGYTGEWGYELYVPTGDACRYWELLLALDKVRPAGLGARDTLRLEMGYPLYGHELSRDRTPVSAARGRFMYMEKDFIGKAAVEYDLEQGVSRYLVGLKLESRRAARRHDKVLHDGHEVGEITSGSSAPSLSVAVAMAYVDVEYEVPGTELEVSVRGRILPATVVELPFYRDGTARG